jgi:hypothetical protein
MDSLKLDTSCTALSRRRPSINAWRRSVSWRPKRSAVATSTARRRSRRHGRESQARQTLDRRNVRHFRPAFICVCADDSNTNFFLSHLIPPFYFCDAGFSRLPALSPQALRFIAAMINTSANVKPRVVIFHITASQLIRSIASR